MTFGSHRNFLINFPPGKSQNPNYKEIGNWFCIFGLEICLGHAIKFSLDISFICDEMLIPVLQGLVLIYAGVTSKTMDYISTESGCGSVKHREDLLS